MKSRTLLLIGLLLGFSSVLHAKELRLDDSYQVFGGDRISLNALIGQRPVYLKFWASWCLDCRREFPSLEQAYRKHHKDIAMFAVNLNINETDETVSRLLTQNQMTIPVLMDNNGSIARNFPFKGTPYHVLINAQGEVVYTTYEDNEMLQQQLVALSGKPAAAVPAAITPAVAEQRITVKKGISLVFFSATWCDWYMVDIHPDTAANCKNAIKTVDQLYREYPKKSLQAYVTHLWTEEKDVAEYVQKFSLRYPVKVDENNQLFRYFKASGYPTLVVLKDGKELRRYTDFKQPGSIVADIKTVLPSP